MYSLVTIKNVRGGILCTLSLLVFCTLLVQNVSAKGDSDFDAPSRGGNDSASQRGQVGGPSGGGGTSGTGGSTAGSGSSASGGASLGGGGNPSAGGNEGNTSGPGGGANSGGGFGPSSGSGSGGGGVGSSGSGGANIARGNGSTPSLASQTRDALSKAAATIGSFFNNPVAKTASGLVSATKAAMKALGITPSVGPVSVTTFPASPNVPGATGDLPSTDEQKQNQAPTTQTNLPEHLVSLLADQKRDANPGLAQQVWDARAIEVARELGIKSSLTADAAVTLAAKGRTINELKSALKEVQKKGNLDNAVNKVIGLGIVGCTSSDCAAAKALMDLSNPGSPAAYQEALNDVMRAQRDATALASGRDRDKEVRDEASTRGGDVDPGPKTGGYIPSPVAQREIDIREAQTLREATGLESGRDIDKEVEGTGSTRGDETKETPIDTTKTAQVPTAIPSWMFNETVPATLQSPTITTNLFTNVPLKDIKVTVADAAKVISIPARTVPAFDIYDTEKISLNPAFSSFVPTDAYTYPNTQIFNAVKSDIKAVLPVGITNYAKHYGIPVMSPAEVMLAGKFDLTRGGKYDKARELAALEVAIRAEIPGYILSKINKNQPLTETDLIEITGIITALTNRAAARNTSIVTQVNKPSQITSVTVDGKADALGVQQGLAGVIANLANGAYAKDLGLTSIEPDTLSYATNYYSPKGLEATIGQPTPVGWDLDFSKPTYTSVGGHIFGTVNDGYYSLVGKTLDLNMSAPQGTISIASTQQNDSTETDDSSFTDEAGRSITVNDDGTGVRTNADGTKSQISSLEVSKAYFGNTFEPSTNAVPVPGSKPTNNPNLAQVPEQIYQLRDKQAQVEAVKNGYAEYGNSRAVAEKAKEAVANDIKSQLEQRCSSCSDVTVTYSPSKQDYEVTFDRTTTNDRLAENISFNNLSLDEQAKMIDSTVDTLDVRKEIIAGRVFESYAPLDEGVATPVGPYDYLFTDKTNSPTIADAAKYWSKETFDRVIKSLQSNKSLINVEEPKDLAKLTGSLVNYADWVSLSGVDPATQKTLEDIAASLSFTPTVTSAYRSVEYNKKVGGAKDSQHIHGKGFDISTSGLTPNQIKELVASTLSHPNVTRIGWYTNGSIHFDTRSSNTKGYWGPNYSKTGFDALAEKGAIPADVVSMVKDWSKNGTLTEVDYGTITTASTQNNNSQNLIDSLSKQRDALYGDKSTPNATLPDVTTNPTLDKNPKSVNPAQTVPSTLTNTVKSFAQSVWEGIKNIFGSGSTNLAPVQPSNGGSDSKNSTSTVVRSDGKLTVEDIVSLNVNFGLNVGCPDLQGVSGNGYVYTVNLKNSSTIITRAGCGLGTPQVYATEIAQDLENNYNFAKIDIEKMFDTMTFKFFGAR